MNFSDAIKNRRSVKSYQKGRDISDAELVSLFDDVKLAPSSFNLQHTVFIAVRDSALKEKLKAAAWGQEQVADSSVVFLVCGKLTAYQDAPEIYSEAPEEIQKKVLPMIHQFYDGNETLQRDEAIRSGSLSAMTLMYAATSRGWATCPMIGFDPSAVSEILELSPDHVPVMMIAMGFEKNAPRPRPYRRPHSEIVRFNFLKGEGLQ